MQRELETLQRGSVWARCPKLPRRTVFYKFKNNSHAAKSRSVLNKTIHAANNVCSGDFSNPVRLPDAVFLWWVGCPLRFFVISIRSHQVTPDRIRSLQSTSDPRGSGLVRRGEVMRIGDENVQDPLGPAQLSHQPVRAGTLSLTASGGKP